MQTPKESRNPFVDQKCSFAPLPKGDKMRNRWRKTLENFAENFEQEKKKAPRLANAWQKAEKRYASNSDQQLTPKDKRIIKRKLPEHIPDEIKSNPEYLAKALIACTDCPAFMARFNKLTREMLADEVGWQKYKFKCFFILSTLAVKFMPRGICLLYTSDAADE